MSRVRNQAAPWLRGCVVGLAATFVFTAIASNDADARSRRKHHAKRHQITVVKRAMHIAPLTSSPRYAAIVIDAKTRKILHQENADGLRHPASLTKMMTLYLLFERLEAGRISLSTQMPVSVEASVQAPTKLGLKPGQTLAVEDAIKGLVTRSANDAAVVIAEALGGSQEQFARMMTQKANALGMTHTVYHNASGLPDDAQVTTARDQAILGIALQERFPRYYRYFSTPSFVYRGHAIRNHNRLLGNVPGVDGIKTGYTNASGFNLVTSMWRGDRHIVAVVLGGASGGQRDARMRELLAAHVMEASAAPAPRFTVAAVEQSISPPVAAVKSVIARLTAAPAPEKPAAPQLGSNEPIKPVKVKTVMVKLAPLKSPLSNQLPSMHATSDVAKPAPEHNATATTSPIGGSVGQIHPSPAVIASASPQPETPPAGAKPGVLGVLPAAAAAISHTLVTPAAATERPTMHGGWAIQIGAFEDEHEARRRLSDAKTKVAGVLKKAEPYTERAVKGDKTWYRARFAGFDRDAATAACKALKRNDIVCMPLKI
jgi:D-alanyl-D-alanine carboxypeptidase